MKQQLEDETVLKRYLLGELTQDERSQVEEQLFLDRNYFQQLQTAEDDLIDDYVYEELPVADRKSFESHFLSDPRHREDLKIARALRKYISKEAEPLASTVASVSSAPTQPTASSKVVSLPFWRSSSTLARLSFATAALILVVIGIWLVINVMRSRNQSRPIQVQQPVPQKTVQEAPRQPETITTNAQPDISPQSEQEPRVVRQDRGAGAEGNNIANKTGRDVAQPREPSNQSGGASGSTLAILLIPGSGVRGGDELNRIPISDDVRFVNLRLPLSGTNNYSSYQAALRIYDKAIRTWRGLKSSSAETANLVSVMVPAKLLHQTNYQIKLSGVTAGGETRDIATYAFQIEKR